MCCQSQQAVPPTLIASTISSLQCNIPAQEHFFPRTLVYHSQTSGPVHRRLHPRTFTSPHLDLPAGNFLLCCKDLLQMLMLSLRWRALRLICQNTFHTLLLKLCPLLFPAFKLKQSPVCQRHGRRAESRCAGLQGQRSEGLSTAQVSTCFMLAPGQRGDNRDPHGPTLLLGLCE